MGQEFDIWVFHRDLRLEGHPGLDRCFSEGRELLPVFILDPEQVNKHPYRSHFGLKFLVSSLKRLDGLLKERGSRLHVVYGSPQEELEKMLASGRVEQVHASQDFTPFSRKRDSACESTCRKHGVQYRLHDALLLHPPEKVLKDDRTPYTMFTPYYRRALNAPVEAEAKPKAQTWTLKRNLPTLERVLNEHPGLPDSATLVVPEYGEEHRPGPDQYTRQRDVPSLQGTTGWSAHLKFGTLSPQRLRASLEKEVGTEHPILRQLFWRDFFHHIAHHFPRVFGESFQPSAQGVSWPGSEEHFEAWCEGQTGFPLVDAGMRELVATGRMHNRVRMVVASFLTKDLEVDWRRGEQFFAQYLEDYDPCINNGNWQWAASTGCDAQPYFRIFNPWLQQKRFDPEALYIKQWVPELQGVDPSCIHRGFQKPISPFYPPPLVDHGEASTRSKSRFAEAKCSHD